MTRVASAGTARRLSLPRDVLDRVARVLTACPWIARATVYGSRAKGVARQGSDIDIVVEGEQMNQRRLNSVATALDDLLLPYKIDLSLRARIDNAALLDHIDRVGVVILDRPAAPPKTPH